MIFETHAHYDDAIFDHDREELLCTMEKQGIGAIVNAGSSLDSIVRIRELIHQYSFMYGAAGIHRERERERAKRIQESSENSNHILELPE